MLRIFNILGAALALTLLVSACGEKKTEVRATATQAAATKAATTAAAPVAANVPAGGSKFCGDWATLSAQAAKVQGAPPSTGASTDLKTSIESANAYFKTMADTAPAEIRGDFQTFAKAWTDYSTVMAKANYDFSKMGTDPELQKAMQAMADPKLQQATTNIQAWMTKNCSAAR